MRPLAGVAGALLVLVTVWSLLRTLVVPRGTSWINMTKNRLLRGVLRFAAHRTDSFVWRDHILMWLTPLQITTSLVMWLIMFFFGYGLLNYAASGLPLDGELREAGSSLFTLGFAATDRTSLTALDFVAAATGPIAIGLLIGYLPTLYSTYQRREAEVTLMYARANEPNWGPELLARHVLIGALPNLPHLWSRWEQWAAEVSESHTAFPVMIQMRSTRPERNWLVALLCVMDAAAMQMSLNPHGNQSAARLMIRQGVICMRALAEVEGIPFDEDPSPDTPSQVSVEEFRRVCTDLAALGFPMTCGVDDAYLHFCGWRANYESVAYELAALIDAVPAPWSGPRPGGLPVVYPRRPAHRSPGRG